jgi:uncharacterized protein (UPF0335 family)
MAKPGPGHNSEKAAPGGVAVERLSSIVQRIERLQEEKQALQGDISDIFAEAKSAGFDCAVIRELLKRRKKEPAELEERDVLLDTYERALALL